MNERIRELAEQAQQYAEYTTPQGLEWLPTFQEKFAELIVRECLDIGYNHKAYALMGEIMEHFGVEQ